MAILDTTYEKTADTQLTGDLLLFGIKAITDGSNDATVIAYDVAASGDAAAGNKVAEIKVAGGDFFGGVFWDHPVRCKSGCWLDVTGTGASFIVYYQMRA